jgi:late competence protein required for DNA uptake (superfamily II DNA/RNA helicase)
MNSRTVPISHIHNSAVVGSAMAQKTLETMNQISMRAGLSEAQPGGRVQRHHAGLPPRAKLPS